MFSLLATKEDDGILPVAYIRHVGLPLSRGALTLQLTFRWEVDIRAALAPGGLLHGSRTRYASLFTLGGQETDELRHGACVHMGYDAQTCTMVLRLGAHVIALPHFLVDTATQQEIQDKMHPHRPTYMTLRVHVRNVGPQKRPSVFVTTRFASVPGDARVDTASWPAQGFLRREGYEYRTDLPRYGPFSLLDDSFLTYFGARRDEATSSAATTTGVISMPARIGDIRVWRNTGGDERLRGHGCRQWNNGLLASWSWEDVQPLTRDVFLVPRDTRATERAGHLYVVRVARV